MDTPASESVFKKYLKPTLITLAVIVIIGLLFYLLGLSFNLIVFQQLWSYIVTKIVGVTGISQWLVKGIVILVLIPVLWVIPNLFRTKYRKQAIVVGLVYFSIFFLSMFFLSRDVYFAHSNQEALKWYALTPEGVKLYDSPGVDPVYGIELKPVTPEIIQKLRLLQKGDFKPIDPSTAQFFNPITGEAQVWFYKYPDGTYEFYDKPGFHPATGEALKPATKEIYLEWRKNILKETETTDDSMQRNNIIQASENNLVPNPSFEMGSGDKPDGWNYKVNWGEGSFLWDNKTSRSGTHSLAIANMNPHSYIQWEGTNTIPFNPNNSYMISCWYKTSSQLIGRNKNHSYVSIDLHGNDKNHFICTHSLGEIKPTNKWEHLSLLLTPNNFLNKCPGVISASFSFHRGVETNNGDNSCVWIDDLSVVELK